ncbi:type I-G CRISPR-associated protein Csb2 [Richelia sinica]|uniref:type I-G CRISPR-associated protein Csb2 n=1 Tax=Richelia sinica TaxID=1357545 RepID=UPI001682F0CD|nr:type I-U CRISPR-associated protein Csb2 [Richelia sinica]MBD2666702.1 type I-U CRISPR-associated protein Cas5/Cas6 [Richelia sinica FACHB-800]
MSVVISIQFLTGRYHATPWDHQVNEGVVEWPPSPWRILRALVSAYYRLPQPPTRTELCQLLTCLANCLPSYVVPERTIAHSRHYMPIWKEGKATTTKVFDTFIVLPGGTLSPDAVVKVVWTDVQLNQSQLNLLKQLCRQVSYLGRSESWVEMQVIDDLVLLGNSAAECNAVPAKWEDKPEIQQEQVKVLVALTDQELEGFKAAIAVLPKPKKGKGKWKAPADILEALELDIGNLHREGWNGIPGSRWEAYIIKSQPKSLHPKFNYSSSINSQLPTFARFALASNVLPNLTEAVSLGERFRQALIAWSKDELQRPASVFSGRKPDTSIQPADREELYLKGQQHAWYLPEVNRQGKIDHVVVYAAKGFDFQQAVPALKNLPKVWGDEGFELQTVLISLGRVEDYATDTRQQEGKYRVIGNSRKWRSLTPMVLPRYPKCYSNGQKKFIPNTEFQIDGPEDQALKLLTCLKYLSIPDNCIKEAESEWLCLKSSDNTPLVKVKCCDSGITQYRWQAFQRRRHHGNGRKSLDHGYWLEVEFAHTKQGPIALGYAAHFGLGVFVPIEE